jgi:hypothetical protein
MNSQQLTGGSKGLHSQLALIRKENDILRGKLSDKATFARQTELEDRVKEREEQIAQLKKEMKGM